MHRNTEQNPQSAPSHADHLQSVCPRLTVSLMSLQWHALALKVISLHDRMSLRWHTLAPEVFGLCDGSLLGLYILKAWQMQWNPYLALLNHGHQFHCPQIVSDLPVSPPPAPRKYSSFLWTHGFFLIYSFYMVYKIFCETTFMKSKEILAYYLRT